VTTPKTAPGPSESSDARRAAEQIVRTLRDAGHVAYFAGGCVRDELLGLEPTDYDVATDAVPQRIAGLFRRTSEVGASFGVVLVKLGGAAVEVATFRSDGAYSDRRRPDQVTFSDPESDARRRDFTVNALFLDPLAPGQATTPGRVIDYVGGMADLNARVLRAVGDADRRLAEDHLRALRCVRLSARLGFSVESGTSDAVRRHAGELSGVSRERIGEELRMMLMHPARAQAVGLLHALELDAPVLGEAHLPAETAGLVGRLGGPGEIVPFPTTLAAWAIGRYGSPQDVSRNGVASRWRSALCLSNEETDALKQLLAGAEFLEQQWATASIARQRRAAGSPWFSEALRLVRVREAGKAGDIGSRVAELQATPPGINPAPYLTGEDLIAGGLAPGPSFKTILDRVYDSQLEAAVNSKDEALAMAMRLAGGMAP
jgi:poly(A) polymerase